MYNSNKCNLGPHHAHAPMHTPSPHQCGCSMGHHPTYSYPIKDYGPCSLVVHMEHVTKQNTNFRTALWTGRYFQITLMCIGVGEDIGLEIHPDVDQFIRIEEGQGLVTMGEDKDCLNFQKEVCKDYAIVVPAGIWHNVINTGCTPLKLYSIYAPPEHPHGTVHVTKQDAENDHHHHGT